MIDFTTRLDEQSDLNLGRWLEKIKPKIPDYLNHGDLQRWENLLSQLPENRNSTFELNQPAIKIGNRNDFGPEVLPVFNSVIRELRPWRKGPYQLFDTYIETEWRSDFKWARFENHVSKLKDRLVLDIGCGNGYHGWRMIGQGAKCVIGIEPFLLSVVQYLAIKKYLPQLDHHILPVGVQDLPADCGLFDTVFSLGLLYHRRSPMDHLMEIRNFLKPNGEFVLETLVIDGKEGEVLVPEQRYAKMRNVWFIPSPLTLQSWLKRCDYKDIRLIDVTKTSSLEQRKTEWMHYESLEDFLDKENPERTIEGYPAPRRAIFICQNPG